MVRDLVVVIASDLVAVEVVEKMVSEVVAAVDFLRIAAPNSGNFHLYRAAPWLDTDR